MYLFLLSFSKNSVSKNWTSVLFQIPHGIKQRPSFRNVPCCACVPVASGTVHGYSFVMFRKVLIHVSQSIDVFFKKKVKCARRRWDKQSRSIISLWSTIARLYCKKWLFSQSSIMTSISWNDRACYLIDHSLFSLFFSSSCFVKKHPLTLSPKKRLRYLPQLPNLPPLPRQQRRQLQVDKSSLIIVEFRQ